MVFGKDIIHLSWRDIILTNDEGSLLALVMHVTCGSANPNLVRGIIKDIKMVYGKNTAGKIFGRLLRGIV